jgi:hypothetical protein
MTDDETIPDKDTRWSDPNWKTVFDFVREENKKDREHLTQTFQRIVWATTTMLLVALGLFFYVTNRSLSDAKQSVNAEMKNQLQEEFSRPELQEQIRQAALVATREKLGDVIRQSVQTESEHVRRETDSQIKQLKDAVALRLRILTPRVLPSASQNAIATAIADHSDLISKYTSQGAFDLMKVELGDSEALGYAKQIALAFGKLPNPPLVTLITEQRNQDLEHYPLAIAVPKSLPPEIVHRFPAIRSMATILQDALSAGGLSAPIVSCDHCNGAAVWVGSKR